MSKAKESSKRTIFTAAIALARRQGLHKFSRLEVGTKADVGESTVSFHFGTMSELRTEIVKHAVEREVMSILADACSSRESYGVPIGKELRRKVAKYVATR